MLENFVKILKQKYFILYFFVWLIIILIPSYFFLNVELIKWNLGINFLRAEITLTAISAILFGIFLASIMYKIKHFSPKAWAEWAIWGAFVMIVSGCPTCSITLAYYIGLAWLIWSLPYHWLELKILWIFLIAYAIYDTLKHLHVCKIKKQSTYQKIKNKISKKSA